VKRIPQRIGEPVDPRTHRHHDKRGQRLSRELGQGFHAGDVVVDAEQQHHGGASQHSQVRLEARFGERPEIQELDQRDRGESAINRQAAHQRHGNRMHLSLLGMVDHVQRKSHRPDGIGEQER
jgi:hypothetical protein